MPGAGVNGNAVMMIIDTDPAYSIIGPQNKNGDSSNATTPAHEPRFHSRVTLNL